MLGARFGSLVAKERVGKLYGYVLWRCVCDCGGSIDSTSTRLLGGQVASCQECRLSRKTGYRRKSPSQEG